MINEGAREFNPSPTDTKEVCRRMYRARSTLLLKFKDDSLDESDEIEKVLREANTIMRMKRPMVEMEVDLKELTGTHITPLTQSVLFDYPDVLREGAGPFPAVPEIILSNPLRDQLRNNFLLTIEDVKVEILTWLDIKLNSRL